jgi:cytochrome c-type biogenesis protein CcmF
MAPVILLMAIAPFLNWGIKKPYQISKRLIFLFLITLLGGLGLFMIDESSLFSIICGSLAIWLLTGVIVDLTFQIKATNLKLNSFKAIFLYFSKNNLGVHIAHMGVAVFLVGVTGEQFYKTEFNIKKNIGDIINIGNKSLIFDKVETLAGPNYKSETATFTLLKDKKIIDVLKPEKRFYPIEKSQTTEAAILSDLWGDTYLVLGDGNKETGWSIRVYFNPLISWIWGGAGFMALGGLASIIQSRKSRKKLKNAI